MYAKMAERCKLPSKSEAIQGRAEAMMPKTKHAVLGSSLLPPYPSGVEIAYMAMGCFWGAEKRFWQLKGVYTTAVGYCSGFTHNPTYEEVCSGKTAHTEAILIVFNPNTIKYADILTCFWESHNPTQGMRQGNDVGTQYRSGIYYTNDQQRIDAEASFVSYQHALNASGLGRVTTEIMPSDAFYFAEDYHQQYLAKNPGGYCGLGGTGVEFS